MAEIKVYSRFYKEQTKDTLFICNLYLEGVKLSNKTSILKMSGFSLTREIVLIKTRYDAKSSYDFH